MYIKQLLWTPCTHHSDLLYLSLFKKGNITLMTYVPFFHRWCKFFPCAFLSFYYITVQAFAFQLYFYIFKKIYVFNEAISVPNLGLEFRALRSTVVCTTYGPSQVPRHLLFNERHFAGCYSRNDNFGLTAFLRRHLEQQAASAPPNLPLSNIWWGKKQGACQLYKMQSEGVKIRKSSCGHSMGADSKS